MRVIWDIPTDEGGTPVTGYKLYLDDILVYDGTDISPVTEYTLQNLVISKTYSVSVSALNFVGEGAKSTLSLVAASVP